MAARILILTAGPLARNPRALKEAQSLSTAGGYEVIVLCPAGRESDEAFDRVLLASARFRKITLPQFSTRPIPPLAHSEDHSPSSRLSTLDSFLPAAFVLRARTWLARKLLRLGLESASALGPVSALYALAVAQKPDLVIAHTEIGLAVGARLRRAGFRVAADIEDWHSEDLSAAARRHRPLRLLRSLEKAHLDHAAYTSTTSAAMAEALHRHYQSPRPALISNAFPLQPEPLARDPLAPVSFFWFSQTLGPGRGLESFLQAWDKLPPTSHVTLLGESSDAYRESLLSLVSASNRPRIHFLPLVAPEALPFEIARHDIGLALEPLSPLSRNLTITNKILQYLNAGLAIVASPTAGQHEVIQTLPAVGIVINPEHPASITDDLTALIANRDQLASRQLAARSLAKSHYNWALEEPKLLNLVATALTRPVLP